MKEKRIVITGVGVVSPIGIGKEEFYRSLAEGKSGIKPITLFDTMKYKVKVAGEIAQFDPESILGKRGLLDLDRASKLLLSSSKLALDDASLLVGEENSSDIGVSVGTTFGSLNSVSKFDRESITEGPRYVNPSVFPSTVGNSPASRVGIRFKIKGFNATISTGMCSALDALDYACDFIELGRVNKVVVGSVEALSIQTFLGCYKLKYLSGHLGGNPLSCPFDERRNGIVLAEGATSFILESLEDAMSREANIYCEILGLASCFDPGRYYKYNLSSEGMALAMEKALADARLNPEDIDCIFANANSTMDADKVESQAIKKVFNQKADKVFVTAIKSLLGETFSVSGGLSLAAAIASLNNKFIPPTINYSKKDSDCDLNYVINKKVDANIKKVMINTFSPNGANTVVIVGLPK